MKIVCELEVDSLTHQQAKVFQDHLAAAAKEVFPDERIRGLWVHRKAVPGDSCCDNEDRDYNGGCRSCGDPCL